MSSTSEMSRKTMPYVRLGNSGLKASRVILGLLGFGSAEWESWIVGEDEGKRVIKAAYDMGVNAFDTANVYSNGESEVILGKAIKEHNLPREEIVVMTKVFFPVSTDPSVNTVANQNMDYDKEGFVNQYGLSRKHIFDSVKKSLARLQLEYVDVLQCHRFDHHTPIEETMHALHDVIQAGYVRYIGMSSCYAHQFAAMQTYALAHGLPPFISMQNQYSLAYREEEREMFPTLEKMGVKSIPWSPLARGFLTRPLPVDGDEQGKTGRGGSDFFINTYGSYDSNREVVRRVEEVARARGDGVTMAQVALAWVMSKPGVAAPVVGTTSVEKLKDLLGAIHLKLSEEEIKILEEPYRALPVLAQK